jgi:hypothetical protein
LSIPYIHFSSEIGRLYPQVMEMLIANTFGRTYMVGGSVTREILFRMRNPEYKTPFDYWNLYSAGTFVHRDLDFIAEEISGRFRVLPGWSMTINTFGGIKLKSKTITVDLWKLRRHDPCGRNGLEYTIENVTELAPLTTQAIAVDLMDNTVIGDACLRALETHTVAVNHYAEALHCCETYQTTINDLLDKKAAEYSFTPIYP